MCPNLACLSALALAIPQPGCSLLASPCGCYPLTLGAQLTQHLPGRSSLATMSTIVSPKLIPATLLYTLGSAFIAIVIVSTFL